MSDDPHGWPIFDLWQKYEDITMHFNDLIIRLRTQALAGVAALSTLVGIFAKADLGPFTYSWEIAGFVFLGLMGFWLSIWILDFSYYNKLLIGSVAALLDLEKQSQTSKTSPAIHLSTLVEQSVSTGLDFQLTTRQKIRLIWGRWAFYLLVMIALLAGASFSFYIHLHPAGLASNLPTLEE